MADADKDRLELLERQLSEKVSERVRTSLFKLYASVGVAVIFVIGFVSWDIVGDIKQELKAEFIAEIEADINSKRERIQELLIRADLLGRRVTATIDTVEKQLTEFQPKAIELEQMYEKVDSLNVDAKNFIDIYNNEVRPLANNVNSLSQQLSVLAEQVDEINVVTLAAGPALSGSQEGSSMQRSAVIQSVIIESDDVQARLETERTRNTVFVQFAGGSPGEVQELAAKLRGDGFYVPDQEHTTTAFGKRDVRYFHAADRSAAEEVAQVVTDALLENGYSDQAVTAQDLTKYANKKPRSGVLELWIDLTRNDQQQQRSY